MIELLTAAELFEHVLGESLVVVSTSLYQCKLGHQKKGNWQPIVNSGMSRGRSGIQGGLMLTVIVLESV